jgi:hypothetical protein
MISFSARVALRALNGDKNQMEPTTPEPIAFSNAIRLSVAQWIGLAAFTAVLAFAAPWLWKQYENFTLEPDYRMPRELSDDYWFYERYVSLAADEYGVLVLGDSAVWGEFVNRQETLSHFLNQQIGGERCANVGLNGAHPLALEGLVEHYAGNVTGKNVLLQCNPTWLRSRKTDLRDVDADVNHERLVPQFVLAIPPYKKEISPRLGVLVERRVPISKWANHLQQAYYRTDGPSDIPGWTLQHPYENPLEPLTRPLPPSDFKRRENAGPWFKSIPPQDFEWIDLDESLQWHAFQRTVETLQRRGNRVFVLVGPFNEHMLTPASLERYQKMKGTIAAWLKEKQVPHLVAAPLPSEQYGDASHPLAEGYETLAHRLLDDPAFRAAIAR